MMVRDRDKSKAERFGGLGISRHASFVLSESKLALITGFALLSKERNHARLSLQKVFSTPKPPI